jgi:hypothetical protein
MALEMRARGVLAPSAVPVLEAHLAACDACREYGARSRRVDTLLAGSSATKGTDWALVQAKFLDRLREIRRTYVLLMGAIIGVFLLYAGLSRVFGGRMPPVPVMALVLGTGALGGSIGLLMRRARLRRLLAEPDPVGAYRRWLKWNLKMWSRMKIWMPIYLIFMSWPVVRNHHQWLRGGLRTMAPLVLTVIGWGMMIVALVIQHRAARRMARELAELH